MKKTTKPTDQKTRSEEPATRKPPAKPKVQGQSELVEIVPRLATITEKLGETTERLAAIVMGPSHPGEQHEPASQEPAIERQHEAPDFGSANEPTGPTEVEEFTLPDDKGNPEHE